MMNNEPPLELRTYELLRDISLPNQYVRAGTRLKGSEWIAQGYAEVSGTRTRLCPRWFRDLTIPAPEISDPVKLLCRNVLAERGLHSLSYIEAAAECVRRAQQTLPQPTASPAVPVRDMTCSTRLFNILCANFSGGNRDFTLVDCLVNGLTQKQFLRCRKSGKASLTELENLCVSIGLQLPL